MTILIVGSGNYAASIANALIDTKAITRRVIVVEGSAYRDGSIASILQECVKEIREIYDYRAGHHYHNLTAPTVSFDRLQQRRKALAKQHFVKPLKKAKKREKRFVNVTWR